MPFEHPARKYSREDERLARKRIDRALISGREKEIEERQSENRKEQRIARTSRNRHQLEGLQLEHAGLEAEKRRLASEKEHQEEDMAHIRRDPDKEKPL